MPIDPSIIRVAPVQSPTNFLSDILSLKNARQANQLNSAKLDAYTQDRARQNKLLEVLGGLPPGATDDDRINALSTNGYLNEADTVRKGIADRKEKEAQALERGANARNKDVETAGKRLDIAGQAFRTVMQNPTLETAHTVLDYLGSNGIFTPDQIAQYKQQTAQNPAAIATLAETAYRSALSAKDQLFGNSTRNTGGATDTIAFDPVTSQTTVTNSVRNTQSPDSIASNQVQMRGQNMTDKRERDKMAADAGNATKPPAGYRFKADGSLEAIPGGPADTKQGGAGARVQDANDAIGLINQAEPLLKDATGSGIGSALDSLGGAFGYATPGSINAQKLKAIEGALVAKMPKMSGPQSDKDVLLYKQMAAAIGDPTIPYERKVAALGEVRRIQERYAGLPEGSSRPAAHPPEINNLLDKYK